MSVKGFVIILCAMLMLSSVAGCTRIEEPWVRDPGQLKQERSVSQAHERELRLRAALYQRDR
jgi:hypothetical protein